jgi:hypothetical protein
MFQVKNIKKEVTVRFLYIKTMSWFSKSNSITNFSGPPKDLNDARYRYDNGDEMVRYHVVYELSKLGDKEYLIKALDDENQLVRDMARQCLKRI